MNSLTTLKSTIDETRKVHLNLPQLLWWLIKPKISVLVWGRATGKTDGPSAMFTAEAMDSMPRCVLRISAYTYEGLLKNVLPGIIKGWKQRYNYVEDVHFWVGKRPPKELGIKEPYRKPLGDPKHMIFWYNGSIALLTSLDRSINNGSEFDVILIEETRLSEQSHINELLLAGRGNIETFEDNPFYGSVLMVTDRPKRLEERWVLDYKKETTPEIITMILECWKRISALEAQYQKQVDAGQEASAEKTQRMIARFFKEMAGLRKKATMFSEASTLDNIHALGVTTIESFIKLLTKHDYNLSVLNKDENKIVDGFYASLHNRHFHRATDYSLLEKNGFSIERTKKNCLADQDCNLDSTLLIAFDANAAINNVVVGQLKNERLYVTNHLFVKSPHYLDKLCERLAEYYEPHHKKHIKFYYDHTMIADNAQGTIPHYQKIIEILQNHDFTVIPVYIGQAPKHEDLYAEWHAVFNELDGYYPVSFNSANCHYLRVSMDNADIKYSSKGSITKDKSSERKDYNTQSFKVDPEEATHASEAMDTLMLGVHLDKSNGKYITSDPSFG
jgi:hypothetical protein